MKATAIAMKQSASVSAIPRNMRPLRRPCELGLAGDRLDRLADDDAHADTGADGGEAEGEGCELSDDVHRGFLSKGLMGRQPATRSVLVGERELDVDGGEDGEDVGLERGDEELEQR